MARFGHNVTIMIVKDAESSPKSIRLSTFSYRLVQLLVILLLLILIVETTAFSRLWSDSQDRVRLLAENAELKEYNSKVVQLEQDLLTNRIMLRKMTELAGIDLADFGWPESETNDSAAVTMFPDREWQVPAPDDQPHHIPSGLPLLGWVSRTFRPNDDNPKMRHFGVDIAVREGTDVVATADGTVSSAGWDPTFGLQVIINHGGGYETVYGHNDSLLVTAGELVSYGDRIALSGNTGISSAPHLHYEIRENGKPVDPGKYLTLPE